MKGLIFDIQRASFVDGEGARTAIFFKGCNLKCQWCHNPEGIKSEAQVLFYKSKCTSCGACDEVCLKKGKRCILCGKCAIVCPNDAKELCGREYGQRELLEIIERDRDLYAVTGGGVTFSGGECMLQIDFLEKLLAACCRKKISVAIDTAGNVPRSYFQRVLPYVDTFYYDIKCMDEELHKKFTGVSNHLILQNLDFLCINGAEVVVRVPVVGGFNDDEKEMRAIFEHLKERGIRKVELLPYHALGEHKYEGAGLTHGTFTELSVSQMEKYYKMLGDIL